MKLLLHVCCGPCAIFPVKTLREEGLIVAGFFYPDNIHPYTECLKRRAALEDYASRIDLPLVFKRGYDLEGFLQKMVFNESERCLICYRERLAAVAGAARENGFDAFSTTLLYSKFQNHEAIRSFGETVGRETGVHFLYRDFRTGWKEGVQTSKRLGMYRQQYCGCIYSEKERYFNSRRPGHLGKTAMAHPQKP
jgi:predicted adenine nucleotide alpha hydrolase (AANH) superfamily ATPase